MKQLLSLLFLSVVSSFLFAQGEGQNWYFGYNAGLDFTGGNPVALTNGSINQWEGVASISDPSGNLLFYTNGQFIWDATHSVMQNGSGLMGHQSATQSSIIVPKPYDPGIFYVFTVDELASGNGVRYSIVDMNLNGGLGAVTSVKNVLLMSNTTEKITAVRHANNSDIWVICHKWNSNQFHAFLINGCSGLQTTPVISSVGSVHNHTSSGGGGVVWNTGAIGYMKASPQGDKIGLAFFTQTSVNSPHFELFDFNNTTGTISNPISLPCPSSTPLPPGVNWYAAYGVEFSPNGRYFYGGLNAVGEIYQYDLLAGGATAIRNSATLVGVGTGSLQNKIGALQLATDGKIYVARDGEGFLGSITNPNFSSAFYTNNAVSLGGMTSGLGLPTFIQSFFIPALDLYIGYSGDDCVGNSISFGLQGVDVPNVAYVDWDFGDGTVLTNMANSAVVSHTYSSPGSYTIQVRYYYVTAGCTYYGTLGGTITVYPLPTVTAVTSGTYCLSGGAVALTGTPSGGTWSGPGVSGNTFYPGIAGVGTHTLTYSYTNSGGCSASDQTTVTVNQAPDATITTTTSSLCVANAPITLTAASSGGTWSGTGVSGNQFNPAVAGVGIHTITYTTSSNGCTDSDSFTITVTNTADATITPVSPLCSNDAPVTLTAANSGGTWSGQGVSGNQFDPSVVGAGTYTVTYVISGACGDSDTETIVVNASPDASFNSGGPFCSDDPVFNLVPAVSGGTFSGTGVSGNQFDPSVAGVGSFSIQYTITNSNNCTSTSTQTYVVNQSPDATITSASALCTSDAPITLTANTAGGTWVGPGVSGNQFDPSVVGGGSYVINYSVSLGSCSNSSSYTITVQDNPDPTITPAGPFCPSNGTITLTAASSGGVWSGVGIVDANTGLFDPSLVSNSTVITYTIGGNCGGSDTETFIVGLGYCDNDNDGINDNDDPDDDNDGILDVDEDLNGNGDFLDDDTDGDGIPNVFDLDSDNDGIVDVIEAGGSDPDGDGIIGTGPITDADNDGLDDSVDDYNSGSGAGEVTNGTPLPLPNSDTDGLINVYDIDSDNDGIVDNIEAQSSGGYIPPANNDADNDGIDDNYDVDVNPNNPIVPVDTDGDASPDYVDTDSDNDYDDDILEGWDTDNDGVADVVPSGNDSDNDGLDDAFDYDGQSSTDTGGASNGGSNNTGANNGHSTPGDFPNLDNTSTSELDWREMLDHDNDGVTDVDDPDDDNDGILDVDEDINGNGDFSDDDTDGDGIPDNFDLDSDNDGIVDVIEAGGTDPDGDGIIGTGPITDVDGDGLADSVDPSEGGSPLPNPDTDGDGMVDVIDLDADNDGIVDNIEAQSSGGYVSPVGTDTDNDGIDDAYDLDNGGTPIVPVDTDEDGMPDYIDLNSDNDNDLDIVEGWDTDNDGIPDTSPSGQDSDNDGIDDAFDVDASSSINNGGPTNGGTVPNDFPNLDDSATEELDWREAETYVIIPNIFTPNDDNVNDVFVLNTSNIKELSATIVNRWGQTIYKWEGVNGYWDGYTRSSQPASEGTYYYIIVGVDNLGEEFVYKGTVVLKR